MVWERYRDPFLINVAKAELIVRQAVCHCIDERMIESSCQLQNLSFRAVQNSDFDL